jgi:dTMP kinase
MLNKGCFITIEGNEGAGKSTIVAAIAQMLASRGIETITTREPGGIAIAEQIRSVILDTNNTKMDGRTEALLYAAARRQHYVEKIAPALQAGKAVICDRFIDSSLAYQGYARGLGILEVLAINEFAIEQVFPDCTLFLDVDPEVGLRRIHASSQREVNRLDLESISFHRQVREGYLQLLERFPDRIIQINANAELEQVLAEVLLALERFLARAGI